jgi:DNA-binding MarR family transcriptional regulator
VSRIESKDDRRIRVVALTAKGQRLIVPIFRKHAADIQQVFAEFSSDRLGRIEKDLKQIGTRADVLPRHRKITESTVPYYNDGVSVT